MLAVDGDASTCQRLPMPTLSVRSLDQRTYMRLRVRAASRGRSMEEEARQILKTAVLAPERMGDFLVSYFGPNRGAALALPKRTPHAPMTLEP
jgi:antitoxin FitA